MQLFFNLNNQPDDFNEGDNRKRVLLALDDGAASRCAFDYFLESPWANDCSLRLMTVVEPVVSKYPDGYSALYSKTLENDDDRAGAVASVNQYMHKLQQRFSSIIIQPILAEGDPAECIVQAARDWAELIVIGGRRRSIIERLWWGSVSQEVIKKAHCTVEVVISDAVKDDRLERFLKANSANKDRDMAVESNTSRGTNHSLPFFKK